MKLSSLIVLASLITACTSELGDSQAAEAITSEQAATASASNAANPPASRPVTKVTQSEVVSGVRKFIEANTSYIDFPFSDERIDVEERIASGFEQDPPRQLALANGMKVVWGWQQGDASRQSIAIIDEKGKVRLVGAAESIPRIYSGKGELALPTLRDYEAFTEERSAYNAQPIVHLYTANQQDADLFYSLALRWLQADMMGFNTHCSEPPQQDSCNLATEIRIPTFFHKQQCTDRDGSSPACRLELPAVTSIAVPTIDDFTQ